MKERFFAVLLFLLTGIYPCLSQHGNNAVQIKKDPEREKQKKENAELLEKEEKKYKKELRKHPNSAVPHWNHANSLAGMRNEAYLDARAYYIKAIGMDSLTPALYRDYGKYLYEMLREFDLSKTMLSRGLKLDPNDEEMKKYLEKVTRDIEKREERNRMYDFGKAKDPDISSSMNYGSIINIDSIKQVVSDPGSRYFYPKLLTRFLSDDPSLSPEDMYLLIAGYSFQPSYDPLNYKSIFGSKNMADYDVDAAIKIAAGLTEKNPLNPSLNSVLMFCYRKKGDEQNAERYRRRIHRYFEGMLFSGNGSCERPWVTLWVKERGNFSKYLGLTPTENYSTADCAGQVAEVLEVVDLATGEKKSIYFNQVLIVRSMSGK